MTPIEPQPTSAAIMWHQINGRLTKGDRGHTICDAHDNPIGIFMGDAPASWASWLGDRRLYIFAAITDTRDAQGKRLYLTFRQTAAYLRAHPDGEPLKDLSYGPNVTYETAMRARILGLQPGELTGHMIPPLMLLRGKAFPNGPITHPNNMFDLRYSGDFDNANNGGFDSRFLMDGNDTFSPNYERYSPFYMSSKEIPGDHRSLYGGTVCGTAFAYGSDIWTHATNGNVFVRPVLIQRQPTP